VALSSILLIQTTIYLTPKVYDNKICSLVYPPFEIPASNSPGGEAIIKIATSAYEVPVIIFLIKSLCPGASMMVNENLFVSNLHKAISIVIPLSLSDFNLSITQAYLNEVFPIDAASFSNLSIVL